jgi:hypothetical protein
MKYVLGEPFSIIEVKCRTILNDWTKKCKKYLL